MRVKVDSERCMGHGMCYALAPEVYEINPDTALNEMGEFDLEPDRRADAARGAAACPERAIRLIDDTADTTAGTAAA